MSKHIERRTVLGGIAGTVGLATLPGAVRAAPSGQPIRIGGTLALTGPLATTALVHKTVAEISVELLNKKDGLLGRPVEWVMLDDQSKPEITRGLYEKLITVDKVDLVVGPYATGAILAAIGVAQRYQKIMIHGTNGMPHLATYEMQFSSSPLGNFPNKTMPPKLYDMVAASKTPPKSVAVVTSKFPSAVHVSTGAREIAEARGLKVPLYLEYEFGTRDFGAIAARLKDANPDLLWLGALGTDSVQLLEACKKIDYKPPRHYHLFIAPGPLALSPEGEHALGWTYFEEHPPYTERYGMADVLPVYKKKAPEARIAYPFFDFQAASQLSMWQLLEKAVAATKSIDDKTLAAWIKTNRVETALGTLRFDGPNNTGDDLSGIKQVIGKKWVTVWPKEMAAPGATPILP